MTRYSERSPVEPRQLQTGDRVMLVWNGYSGVPKHLHQTWATVVKVNRTRVAVDADQEAHGPNWPQRWARLDQIAEHEPVGRHHEH